MSIVETRLKQLVFLCMCGFALTIESKTAIPDTFTGIALCLSVGLFIIQKKKNNITYKINPYLRVIGIFFCMYFLSIFISGDIVVAAKAYWRYLNRMIPFFLVLFFVREKKSLCIILICSMITLFIDSILVVYNGIILAKSGATFIRASGLSTDVIGTGGFLLIYLPLMLVFVIHETYIKRRCFYILMLIIGVAALLFNGTRIAWVAILLVCIVTIGLYGKNIKRLGSLFFVGCFLLGIMGYNQPFIQDRIYSFTNMQTTSNQGHYSINKSAFEMIADKPILGWGLGQFPIIFNKQYISAETQKIEGHISHAHNDTLTIGAENGIVGIFVFWLMFGSFLYYSLKAWHKSKRIEDLMFFVVTLAAVIQGLTDTRFGMHAVNKLYFLLVAVYLNYRYGGVNDNEI